MGVIDLMISQRPDSTTLARSRPNSPRVSPTLGPRLGSDDVRKDDGDDTQATDVNKFRSESNVCVCTYAYI